MCNVEKELLIKLLETNGVGVKIYTLVEMDLECNSICGRCKGEKYKEVSVFGKNVKVSCTKCNGNGYVNRGYIVTEQNVRSLDSIGGVFRVNGIKKDSYYTTKEEAQKMCDFLNK